jgi:hypothetical protein
MKSFLGRYWFALALTALVVVSLPGAALYAASFWGIAGPINSWLQNAFRLSYHLYLPGWASLTLLLVPFAIVILYFLKLKRKPLGVPSTFLWRKSIEDLHVNSLLQWLRQNVLLLLQLLAVLALFYGVMAFRLHGRAGSGQRYILMLDNSASMSATDVAPNRVEWAKSEALKTVDSYSDSDIGMVMIVNSGAEILQSFTTNRGLLRQAIREIKPTERTTRIEEALSLADSLANPVRSTEDVASQPENPEPGKDRLYVAPRGVATTVHLFSDGRFPDLSEAALANLNSRLSGNESALGNLSVDFHLAGKPGQENVDNIGIVTLNAVRDDRDSSRVQVFARVLNYRSQEVRTEAQLEVVVNGALKKVYGKTIVVAARSSGEGAAGKVVSDQPDSAGETAVTFDVNEADDQSDVVLHLKLVNLADRFPLDDEAWLVMGMARKTRVLIVGPFNDVLQKFFDAPEVKQVAEVVYMSPGDLQKESYREPARNAAYDLVIFDRCAPASEQDMPRSNTLFVGCPPPPWKRDSMETVENPRITGWKGDHPVLRDLRALYTIEVDQSFKMNNLPPRTPLLIEGRRMEKSRDTDTSLLVALSRQAFTDLVLTFPILNERGEWNTTWPLQASFPLFLRNVLYAYGNLSESATEETVQPGQVKVLRPQNRVRRLDVSAPDGATHPLHHGEGDTRPDFVFGATDRVGVYKAAWPGGQQSFAVNLLDAEESNIEPKATLVFGTDKVVAGQDTGQPRELWKWFALLALAVLVLEWYVYNRRIYV